MVAKRRFIGDIATFLHKIDLYVDIDWYEIYHLWRMLQDGEGGENVAERGYALKKNMNRKILKELWKWSNGDIIVYKSRLNPKTGRRKIYVKIKPKNVDELFRELHDEHYFTRARVKGKYFFFIDETIRLSYEYTRKITAQDVLNLFSLLDEIVKGVQPEFVVVEDMRGYEAAPFPVKKIKTEKELYEWVIGIYTAIKKNRVDKKLMEKVMEKDKWWEDRGTHYVWINQRLKKMLEKAAFLDL